MGVLARARGKCVAHPRSRSAMTRRCNSRYPTDNDFAVMLGPIRQSRLPGVCFYYPRRPFGGGALTKTGPPMPNFPAPSNGAASKEDTLTDRVAARVIDARLAIEQRATASSPKSRRSSGAPNPGSNEPTTLEERREAQSLRRVFRDMGISYRRYRSQVGGPVVPGLRDAAYRFRAAPSLASLVAVAAYLDELDLLS